MTTTPETDDQIRAIALLDEPNRRRIFEVVSASRDAVGRDEMAAELGISRELAAFHLDRLVDGGLLTTEYRRRNGRNGPGAGRPAKLYRRADRDVAVSIPDRRYGRVASIFATGLDGLAGRLGIDAVSGVARQRGAEAGLAVRRTAGPRPSRRLRLTALVDLLREAGYEPEVDRSTGAVTLRNCPYSAVVDGHRDLTCGMNLAWAEGVAATVDPGLRPELDPLPGQCCVVFRQPGPASP
jgi:predicted ArsR family transcriptional regulator